MAGDFAMTSKSTLRRFSCSLVLSLCWVLFFVVSDLLVGEWLYEWFFSRASGCPVWVVPIWIALPGFCFSIIAGAVARLAWRPFDSVALLLCCISATAYYLWRHYGGGIYVDPSLLAYAIALLPPISVSIGFAMGYSLFFHWRHRS